MAFYFINARERFGRWTDDALWRWYQVADNNANTPYGAFSIRYLPYNIYTALFMGPSFGREFPWLFPTVAGQSLLTTSPALLLALRSKDWKLWLATMLSMAAAMLVYSNGTAQLGARYWILAYPFLLLMMAEQRLDRLGKILIMLSVVWMAFWMWVWRLSGY